MKQPLVVLLGPALALSLLSACSDGGGDTDDASATGTSSATATTSASTSNASASATATEGSSGGASMTGASSSSSSSSSSSAGETSSGSSSGTGVVTASTTDTGTTSTTGGSTEGSSSTTEMGPKCQPGDMQPAKSFLWAANSSQGTISKIDTETVTEVGRYIVRPDSAGSPSRTSVSLTGHVAVANRNGGVTKIYSDESYCQESNGTPGIQTSKDANFLPWGTEECIAWHTPFPYQSQRPVAWGPGVFNEETCLWEEEELWTAGKSGGDIDIMILDGDDGAVKEKITVPVGGDGLNSDFYGIYGAAVDPDGNLWGSQLGSAGKLITVSRVDMSYKIYKQPVGPHWYGMTVDADGIVFLCGGTVGRFDPVTESWTTNAVGGYAGCMADSSDGGLLWVSNGSGVVGVNRDTLAVEKTWNAEGSYGVSVDFDGFVWVVAYGSTVSKINKDDGTYQSYNGLVGAYTYSDMIGYSLAAAVMPQ